MGWDKSNDACDDNVGSIGRNNHSGASDDDTTGIGYRDPNGAFDDGGGVVGDDPSTLLDNCVS